MRLPPIPIPPHYNTVTNRGKFADMHWKTSGVGIYKGKACAWFGKVPDSKSRHGSRGSTHLEVQSKTGPERAGQIPRNVEPIYRRTLRSLLLHGDLRKGNRESVVITDF